MRDVVLIQNYRFFLYLNIMVLQRGKTKSRKMKRLSGLKLWKGIKFVTLMI